MSGARWPLRGLGYLAHALTPGFRRALDHPAQAQERLRQQLLRDHASTALGQHDNGLVPPRTFAELQPWLPGEGRKAGALSAPIRHWEPTSGSESATKLIPYTRPLLASFSRMFLVWVADLLLRGPALRTGRFYMSVSPSFDTGEGPAAFEDDSDYLDGWLRPLVDRFVVRPREAERAPNAEVFRQRLARALVAEGELEVISVWNPSFLTVLLDHIEAHADELAPLVDPSRRHALTGDTPDWRALWPRLRLVSAWADGAAAHGAQQLLRRTGFDLQPKGLLATEGPVTVPITGAPAGVPLIHDVLIELLTDDGSLIPLTDGTDGEVYELVIWPRGGLPRYRLGDRVRLQGRYRNTPCLQLLGRTGGVSDLVGEKLHPEHVATVLDALLPDARHRMLVPCQTPRDHYVLLVDGDPTPGLAQELDAALKESWHYRLARQQLQLTPPRVLAVGGLAAWWQRVGSQGKLGDTKDRVLVCRPMDREIAQLEQGSSSPGS